MRATGRAAACATGACTAILLLGASAAATAGAEKLQGVVERVSAGVLTVDSADVYPASGMRVEGDIKSLDRAKVGMWAELEGRWKKRGEFEASLVQIQREAPGQSYSDNLLAASQQETRKLVSSDKLLKDDAVEEYVARAGQSLIPEYAKAERRYTFHVIKDPTLNAFALPSGDIFVHTGLLARLDNEAQLAVVLGHEISHVTQLHGQRQYRTNMTKLLPAQIGAAVLGIGLERKTDNPVLKAMVGMGVSLGVSAAVSGYGRTLEDQADRVGLRYQVDAGYDPREGPAVWDIFNDVTGDESQIENFFYGNHSTNAVRKENLEEEIHRHYSRRDLAELPARRPNQASVYRKTMLDVTRDNAIQDFDLRRYRLAATGFQRVLEVKPDDDVSRRYLDRISKMK